MGKKSDSGSISVISENKEEYISFSTDVVMGLYKYECGRIKKKKILLRFIDSIRFMASSLDSLARNLVGVNGMMCEVQHECRSNSGLTHTDENYIAHGICTRCRGLSHPKLEIDPIFDNLRVGNTDKQFPLLIRKGVYSNVKRNISLL